jgi:eukaryotic-like serine/threonine-protein kinase
MPAQIGRYRVEGVIGSGTMGVIYRAHDPVLDRAVAIKLIRPDLLEGMEREEFLERFSREAKAAGSCAHPNIVAVYDFDLHEGSPFIAMEFVTGASLATVLRQGVQIPPRRVVSLVAQVLDALSAAHRLGIVHRDIKPANILLLVNGQVKLTDFGVSLLDGSSLTQHGTLIGTPSYMSPEQCRGDEVDQRSDLFSVGAVCYELLAGERLFSGRTTTELVSQVLAATTTKIADRLRLVPAELRPVLARALAPKPQQRFASAGAMADALRQSLTVPDGKIANSENQPSAVIAPGEFDQATRALARYVGPIAAVLVKRAGKSAGSADELWQMLAHHISETKEREAFLRLRRLP